jgi:hypothetical protein
MNDVMIYQQIADPVAAIETIGKAITLSRIFGCQNDAQGQILALECLAKKLPPLALAERYHLIDGKLSMKADAMLAGFEDAGGTYEIREYSPDACEINFLRGKNQLTVRITWDMAQQEKWPYGKGGKETKTNWSTAIGRQDMLWARVVSRGVRRLAPGVVCGRYTPEEIGDIEEDRPIVKAKKADDVVVVDAVSEPVVEPIEDAVIEIKSEPMVDERHQISISEPCSELQVASIKSAIEKAAQLGIADLPKKIKTKLASSGLQKLSDLTIREADLLLSAIENKSMATFLDLSLGAKPPF